MLVYEQNFRRLLSWSLGVHLLAIGFWVVAPMTRRAPLLSAPIFVDVVAAPKAAARPKRARQVVDEPVVIPKKPKPLPKPKPEAKPKPEPKPKPEAKPKAPPISADELLAKLRQKVEARDAATARAATATATSAGAGRFDPQMAAYHRKLKALLYANWVGAQVFRGQGDLSARFQVQIDPSGGLGTVALVGSSGNRYFDESAERAIWKTRPFPRPPRGGLTLTLDFDPKEPL